MAWRPAYSLQTLKDQLDADYPGWLFLGFLGDQAHASVPSDHNPNSAGVVCALDIGPGGGLDIHALADRLAAQPQPDCKYIISNRRIAEWQYGFKWRAYSGTDPHDTHIHVSVGRGDDGQSRQPYDDRVQWNVTGDDVAEPVFNEGDRQNLNNALYGYDKGFFKTTVGRNWKDSIYAILQSDDFKNENTVNAGDVKNINATLGGDASVVQNKIWKQAVYNYILKNSGGDYVPVTKPLYEKKG